MKRLIFNVFLIFAIHEIFSTVAATEYESCSLNQHLEEQCKSYTYSIVRPMLDYYRQVSDELQQTHKKDEIIRDLREKLVGNEVLIQQLQSQIDFQKQTIERITTNSKLYDDYDKCKVKSAQESNKFQIREFQLNKVNSSPNEKDEIQTDKLEMTVHNISSSRIPFGKCPGVYKIQLSSFDPFDVLCNSELAGPGWIVMQQQMGGHENFLRNWTSYREGFGSFASDFFLGLEKIHRLTNSQRYELYIHLVAANGTTYYARYDDFKISDEDNGYTLRLGKFEGNAGDAMRYAEHIKFSTFDRDNDFKSHYNCALIYKSGWWYTECCSCNLNAPYDSEFKWWGIGELHKAKMLIRPKN